MKIKSIFIILIGILLFLYTSNLIRLVVDNIDKVNITSSSYSYESIKEQLKSSEDKVIVIDPGHGGKDPGKIGINNSLEKDINLSIAFKLKEELLNSGFCVVMTRTKDVGLYNDLDVNKKNADLRNRVNIINNSDAIAVISIHQNAYTSNEEKGAQVFYLSGSNIGHDLAKSIQDSMKKYHDEKNTRVEKENKEYYLLKKTIKPTVIVECGFLSNMEEANRLVDLEYQGSIAKSINNGIVIWANNILESVY